MASGDLSGCSHQTCTRCADITVSLSVFRQGDIGTNWYAVLAGSLDVKVSETSSHQVIYPVIKTEMCWVCRSVVRYLPSMCESSEFAPQNCTALHCTALHCTALHSAVLVHTSSPSTREMQAG